MSLCSTCFYGKTTTTRMLTHSLNPHYSTFLVIDCTLTNATKKFFIKKCKDYKPMPKTQKTLDYRKPQYEYLPQKLNECGVCKGKGFTVMKVSNAEQRTKIQSRFRREKCENCKGKGYLK